MSIDKKQLIFNAVVSVASEAGVRDDDMEIFAETYDILYEDTDKVLTTDKNDIGLPFTSEEFIDQSMILAIFWVTKHCFEMLMTPVVKKKVLPKFDEVERSLADTFGHFKWIHAVRMTVERQLRKIFDLPDENDD